MLTVGVEEEFLLLDPEGAVLPLAPAVLGRVADERVKAELMTYQVETNSGVCTDLGELERQLGDLRRRVAAAAGAEGARLVAAGTPPGDERGLDFLTDSERYRSLAARFPAAVATGGTCACQVHLGMADRDLAVQVLGRLRPWLPTLLALGTNSPVSGSRDSGWSSTRYRRQLRWPTFAAPAAWATADAYDRSVAALVRNRAAYDERSVYLLARLSPRHPTIEIRVADTALETWDAVLLAGVCRALVASLVADQRRGRPPVTVSDRELGARLLAVAARGAPVRVPSQRSAGPPVPARGFSVTGLRRKILPELRATGDAELVMAGLDRLARVGTGAQRQRRLLAASRDLRDFVTAVAAVGLSEVPAAGTA